MTEDTPFISVVIPVASAGTLTRESLQTVLRSVEDFERACELVLVLNGLRDGEREELDELLTHPSVVWVERADRIGSAPARCLGVDRARGRYTVMTDADCMVPADWVSRMARAAAEHDVACGQVQAANTSVNACVRIEEEIDRLRNSTATPSGTRRYPTTANMIARRDLLALIANDRDNTAEDIQLSLEYMHRGIRVASVDDVVVRTIYPSSLMQCMSRRAKHAKGTAFAQGLWTRREWRGFGMRGPVALALAGSVRVWRMRLSRFEQLLAFGLRLWFAAAWAWYLVARVGRPRPRRSGEVREASG